MTGQSSGYQEFRRVADALRRRVKISAVVSSSKRYLAVSDPCNDNHLARAVNLGARAHNAQMTAEEFKEALQELKHQLAAA